MKIIGIIAEYNPFHNGHLYMLKKIRMNFPDSIIIVVMSGSFCQRGETAILDKWVRAKLAITGGADIIFELPFVYATRSGEYFATGAISILNALNVVDVLAFGSESADLTALLKIADSIENKIIQEQIHANIAEGASYAAALTKALKENTDINEKILSAPNDILAVSYLRTIKKINSKLEPFLITRKEVSHNETEMCGAFASASAIRRELIKSKPDYSLLKKTLPQKTFDEIKNPCGLHLYEKLFTPLLVKLYTTPATELGEIYGVNEGIENRILNMAKESASMTEFIDKICTKRYSKSRINRITTHILAGFTKNTAEKIDKSGELYARLLAFNERGTKILGEIKKKSYIPIIEKTGRFINEKDIRKNPQTLSPIKASLFYDIRGTFLQSMTKTNFENPAKDFLYSPIFEKQ